MLKRLRSVLLAAALLLAMPAASFAGVFVSVTVAPPLLPVYAQPLCPGPGYLWTPGYWAWGPAGYYWVPGAWVIAPRPGLLWTPGYWAFDGMSRYIWHAGYWATSVGFYGGIAYGHGYYGSGYHGGYWRNGAFYYNRDANHIDITRIHNVYRNTVIRDVTVNRASYNGGHGGRRARPTPAQRAQARRPHWDAAHAAAMPHRAVSGESHSWRNDSSPSRYQRHKPDGEPGAPGSDHQRPIPQRQHHAHPMHDRRSERRGAGHAPERGRAHGEGRDHERHDR